MMVKIFPSVINGTITAPPSKSLSHRALIAAVLCKKITRITNLSNCHDVLLTIRAIRKLGGKIQLKNNKAFVCQNNLLTQGKKPIKINCGNSGTTARIITALAAICNKEVVIDGDHRLQERPMAPLISALKKMGAAIYELKTKNHLPLKIMPSTLRNRHLIVDINQSSQFVTALILISPLLENNMQIKVLGNHSFLYINSTLEILKLAGIKFFIKGQKILIKGGQIFKPFNYAIEGDYSAASYFLIGALLTGGQITVKNLIKDSIQGDKYLLKILKKSGCKVTVNTNQVFLQSTKSVFGLTINMGNYPDLVPSLSILAIGSSKPILMKNIAHLVNKESNRITAMSENLKIIGLHTKITDSSLKILPGKIKDGLINSYNDHRLVMSFSIAALSGHKEIIINHAESVKKSYPDFFTDLKKTGGKFRWINH
ncbi:3-phosphoshikimate 1-carboxyvinyltransferase [Candidatus Gottesmanbacteria bacterium RBG_16_37_8]|uniref:3-phosphoshikimate 1-carboxyvinyltransferase n=1 Tax=Candidatus Gottesmanbacteria bacterium RBG_16_37_8 TaxID=1798371 RepID=A0A1F5YTV3_9BACT|nr:MAG: 3-phosphoshikimate 1-carboxyvinyltransferase [Candidatus Gottesmanbacteria bacterium RBG_16_37_8]